MKNLNTNPFAGIPKGKPLMTTAFFLNILLFFATSSWGQHNITVNFSDGHSWAGGTMNNYNDKTYAENGWLFSSADAVRETTEVRRKGSYSWRIRTSTWVTKNTTPATYTGFEIKIRPWGTTEPNASNPFTLSVSLDGGDNWTSVQEIIVGVDPLVWLTYDYHFDETEFEEGAFRIKLEAQGTGQRLNVGEFTAFVPVGNNPVMTSNVLTLSGLSYQEELGPSPSQSFELTGFNLNNEDVTISAPQNFEISESEIGAYASTITFAAYDGTATDIWVRLSGGLSVSQYAGNVEINGGGADQVNVGVSGRVVPAFSIPYSNDFRTDDDREVASIQGFDLGTINVATDYSRLTYGAYIETPVVDFSAYEYLKIIFSTATFGGSGNQELHVQVSVNGGSFEEIYSAFPAVADPYLVSEYIIDLTDEYNNPNGLLRFTMASGTNSTRFRDLSIEPFEYPSIANPVFDLDEGTCFEDQTVFISNYKDFDASVTIYYTTDGTDPDSNRDEYDNEEGILLQDGNGPITLKAIAIGSEDESVISTAVYTFPVNVADIEILRQQTMGSTIYRVANESTFLAGTSFRNTRFFQDDSGFGIQIDDPTTPAVITTTYNIGDNVKELIGTLREFQNQLQLTPAVDPGAPVSTGNVIVPVVRTLDELSYNDQSRLVKVLYVEFEDGNGTSIFGGDGSSTNITDPSLAGFTGLFRNVFGESDITDALIPEKIVNVIGVIQRYSGGYCLAARNMDDIEPLAQLEVNDNEITLKWNAPIGTFDAGIIINNAPYNTDGGFLLVKLFDEDDQLVVFADVFEEFSVGDLHYHSGTSNRLLADFTAQQQDGIWGTQMLSDNPTRGNSLRETDLDGTLFYGVMDDGVLGTVGFVFPGTGSVTKEMAFLEHNYTNGDYTLVAEFYAPLRPGDVGTTAGFYTLEQLKDLELIASAERPLSADDIPDNLVFTENLSVPAGDSRCFNACLSILVGGDYAFEVEAGASVELRAGEQIIMMPGVRVMEGGYLLAQITKQYCPVVPPMAPLAKKDVAEDVVTNIEFPDTEKRNPLFKVFPNPTPEAFTLEIDYPSDESHVYIEIYSMLGNRVLSERLPAERQYSLSLEGQQPGIYIVRVLAGNSVSVERLIKR